jgi:uncharacterized lipoprotein YbaY
MAFVSTLISVCCAQTPSSHAIDGEVGYLGFDALPRRAKVHVYANDTRSGKQNPALVAEQTVLTEGQQVPIKFSLSIPNSKVISKHVYSVCADISIFDRPAFVCDKPFLFKPRNWPKHVVLTLRRVP